MCDIVSDLHIDQWDKDIGVKYPCGLVKHAPYTPNNSQNKILIVAGDVSDSLHNTIKYLDTISVYYEKILFVDGNHEHVNMYPNLYTHEEINEKIKKLNNNKIVYLPCNPYQQGKTLFIGACGWWDYNNANLDAINSNLEYFKHWLPHLTRKENHEFIDNVIKRSREDYSKLEKLIELANQDQTIENIIIVTHCVPKRVFCCMKNIETILNTKFEELIKNKTLNRKLTHWIFGHIHHNIYQTSGQIKFICHPRGRPEDYNRELYDLFSSKL